MKITTGLLVAGVLIAADSKVKMPDLPAAVQATVKEQSRGAAVVGLSKEVEGGKTLYEVELKVNGKTRDLMIDPGGTVAVTEDEVDLDSIPAAAQAALHKKAGTGKITKVEKVTEGPSVAYEAAIKTKAGKNTEAIVNADGSAHKE